jgi:hypothetical protein
MSLALTVLQSLSRLVSHVEVKDKYMIESTDRKLDAKPAQEKASKMNV